MTTQYKSKSEIKAEQQATQGKQSNTATLDRPVCDEIKEIFITSMTSTYEACNDARNRGFVAGIEKFRKENTTGNDDFFSEWEVEAVQILDLRSVSQNALPSSPIVFDLSSLAQYATEDLDRRLNELAAKKELSEAEALEFDAIEAHFTTRLEASNASPE